MKPACWPFLLVLSAVATAAPRGGDPTFSIVFSKNLNGETEPCGCLSDIQGGLARRSQIVADLRKTGRPVLHVDSGDVFFKKPKQGLPKMLELWDQTPGLRNYMTAAFQLTAEAIVDSYNLMGVDAICPGERDFMLGVEFLDQLRKRAKFPFVCANVYPKGEKGERKKKDPVFTPWIVKELGGVKVVIVGVATDWLYDDFPHIAGKRFEDAFWIEDPVDYLERMKGTLRAQGDLVVVLSHMGVNEDLTFSRHGSKDVVDFMIGSCTPNVWDQAYKHERANPIRIYHPPEQGKGVGLIDFTWLGPKKSLFDLTDIDLKVKKLGLVRAALESDQQARKVHEAEPRPPDEKAKILEAMDRQLAEKETVIRRLESETAVTTEDYNLLRYKMVDMETSLPEEAAVKKRLDELKSALTALVTAWKESDRKAGAGDEQYQKYAGQETCRGCHTGQHDFWSQTKHAHAMETLEKVIQAVNPECIGCHSLGFREEGGFQRPYNASRFANVQCEHCHGPRAEHVKNPLKSAKSPPVTAEACKPCHASAGPKFDFASAIKTAGCPPELSFKKPEKK